MLASFLALLALLLGAAIGVALPDVDRIFGLFLTHRSIVTHSLLLPLLAYQSVREGERWQKLGVASLSLAVAVHLSFDLFPRQWIGFALLHAPLVGQINLVFSMLVLGGSMVGCCYLALRLLPRQNDLATALVVALVFFFIASRREQHTWGPLLLLVMSFCTATCLPGSPIDGPAIARRWQAAAGKR